jgi:hypothetical protein
MIAGTTSWDIWSKIMDVVINPEGSTSQEDLPGVFQSGSLPVGESRSHPVDIIQGRVT